MQSIEEFNVKQVIFLVNKTCIDSYLFPFCLCLPCRQECFKTYSRFILFFFSFLFFPGRVSLCGSGSSRILCRPYWLPQSSTCFCFLIAGIKACFTTPGPCYLFLKSCSVRNPPCSCTCSKMLFPVLREREKGEREWGGERISQSVTEWGRVCVCVQICICIFCPGLWCLCVISLDSPTRLALIVQITPNLKLENEWI